MTTNISHVQSAQATIHQYEINEQFLYDILDPPHKNQELSTIKLYGQFVHSQLFIDRLLQVPSTMNEKEELISSLKKLEHSTDNNRKILNEFKENYSKSQAVSWYTREDVPLQSSLNKASRIQDIDCLFLFRFFIRDIRDQLGQFQYKDVITVYRAQQMWDYELEKLKNLKGKKIAVNSFFSTSIDPIRALFRLGLSQPVDNNIERVLFVICLDPTVVTTKPFADITTLSAFPIEEEVLIMLGSTFHLLDIHPGENKEKGAWIIEMKLIGDNDNELAPIIDAIKANNGESDGESGLLLFAHELRDMSKFDDAERYYQRFLENLSQDNKKMISRCYHGLGNIMDDKGDYGRSLELLEKAYQILMGLPDPDDERLVRIQISFGATCSNNGCLEKALSWYNSALSILDSKSVPSTHYLRVMCHINRAEVFLKQKNYPEADKCLKTAFVICQKSLPDEHDLLGGCYNGFGEVKLNLGELKIARKNFIDALEQYHKSLTPYNFFVGDALENMGKTYEMMGNTDQAFLYYSKSGTIYGDTLLPTHRKVLENKENKQRVSSQREG